MLAILGDTDRTRLLHQTITVVQVLRKQGQYDDHIDDLEIEAKDLLLELERLRFEMSIYEDDEVINENHSRVEAGKCERKLEAVDHDETEDLFKETKKQDGKEDAEDHDDDDDQKVLCKTPHEARICPWHIHRNRVSGMTFI